VKKFLAIPLCLAFVASTVAFLSACKQGEGERCQVSADCDDGLVCNQATQECAQTTGGGIDATVPDGVDAVPDAPPDVLPDT